MNVAPVYGLNYVVPENAIAAWGCRLIVTQQGYVDFVPDRQGSDGGEHSQELLNVLNDALPLSELKDTVSLLLRGVRFREGNGFERVQMMTREAEDFILYLDDRLVVHANTNASAGYCYVTAWLYPKEGDTED
jgi:hypothetical protein